VAINRNRFFGKIIRGNNNNMAASCLVEWNGTVQLSGKVIEGNRCLDFGEMRAESKTDRKGRWELYLIHHDRNMGKFDSIKSKAASSLHQM
jgi:hypothetical protein